jgi:hypothetical protein
MMEALFQHALFIACGKNPHIVGVYLQIAKTELDAAAGGKQPRFRDLTHEFDYDPTSRLRTPDELEQEVPVAPV